MVKETFTAHDWHRTSECAKRRSVILCRELRHTLYWNSTYFRQAISVERHVAVDLWCLATPSKY